MGFVFCDSYYSTGALCTKFTLVFIKEGQTKPYNLGKGLRPKLWFRIWVGIVVLALEVGRSSLLFMFIPFPFWIDVFNLNYGAPK